MTSNSVHHYDSDAVMRCVVLSMPSLLFAIRIIIIIMFLIRTVVHQDTFNAT